MTFPYLFPSGLGLATGDIIATQATLYSSGLVRYVDSSHDAAADSGTGTSEARPWATLAYALTQATTGDIIVLGADHAETVTASEICATNRLSVIGAASSGGDPTAVITCTTGSVRFTGNDTLLANVKFVCGGQDTASGYVVGLYGDDQELRNVLIEMGADCDGTFGVSCSGVYRRRLDGLRVVSTAEIGDVLPLQGLYDGGATGRIDLLDCVFDGGVAGFDFAGAEVAGSAGKMAFVDNVSLLRGADLVVDSDCVGRIGVGTATGQATVKIV